MAQNHTCQNCGTSVSGKIGEVRCPKCFHTLGGKIAGKVTQMTMGHIDNEPKAVALEHECQNCGALVSGKIGEVRCPKCYHTLGGKITGKVTPIAMGQLERKHAAASRNTKPELALKKENKNKPKENPASTKPSNDQVHEIETTSINTEQFIENILKQAELHEIENNYLKPSAWSLAIFVWGCTFLIWSVVGLSFIIAGGHELSVLINLPALLAGFYYNVRVVESTSGSWDTSRATGKILWWSCQLTHLFGPAFTALIWIMFYA